MQLLEVRYGKNCKRISLSRFLISKIVYEAELVSDHDLVALFDNQIWLEDKCLKDYDFYKKFGTSLEEVSYLLKNINLSKGLSPKALLKLSIKLRELKSYLVPLRNYPAFKARFGGSFSIIPAKQPGVDKKRIPPKKVIGLGYRDKGTMRNPAKDGSPPWQEVASPAGQESLFKRRIRDASKFNDLVSAFIDYYELDPREVRDYLSQNSDRPSKET